MIRVHFDRPCPLFLAGETISGDIEVDQEESVLVTFQGLSHSGWADSSAETMNSAVDPPASDVFHFWTRSFLFEQRSLFGEVYTIPPKQVARGSAVVYFDATISRTPSTQISEELMIFRIYWLPGSQKTRKVERRCLGRVTVKLGRTAETTVHSFTVTPDIDADPEAPLPDSISLTIDGNRSVTVHSVTMNQLVTDLGFLQVQWECKSLESKAKASQLGRFCLQIPTQSPPSVNFAASHFQTAGIRYHMFAAAGEASFSQQIFVLAQNPIPKPILLEPVYSKVAKCSFAGEGMFGFNFGSVILKLGIAKRVFTPGERLHLLPAVTQVVNATTRDVKINIRLTRWTQMTVADGYVRQSVVCKHYPVGTTRGRFGKVLYPEETWEYNNEDFVVPSAPSSSIDYGMINGELPIDQLRPVRWSYTLQIYATMEGSESTGKVEIPVFICGLPQHWKAPNNRDLEMKSSDTVVRWKECLEPTKCISSLDVPDAFRLDSALWNVSVDSQRGVFSPNQQVLTFMDDFYEGCADEGSHAFYEEYEDDQIGESMNSASYEADTNRGGDSVNDEELTDEDHSENAGLKDSGEDLTYANIVTGQDPNEK